MFISNWHFFTPLRLKTKLVEHGSYNKNLIPGDDIPMEQLVDI